MTDYHILKYAMHTQEYLAEQRYSLENIHSIRNFYLSSTCFGMQMATNHSKINTVDNMGFILRFIIVFSIAWRVTKKFDDIMEQMEKEK